MNIFLVTFGVVFALLGIGVLGFWLIAHHRVASSTLGFMSALAIDIALPFLVLGNLIRDFSPADLPEWWQLPIWWVGFALVSLALSLATSFMVRKGIRSEFTISLLYQNGLFFPLVILSGLFGPVNQYLVPLFVFMLFHPTMVFSTYALFFPGRKKETSTLNWRRLVNPVIVSTFIGMVISLVAIRDYIPDFILNILTMVGAMATPLFMLILGGNIFKDFKERENGPVKYELREVAKFVFIKNIIFPLVFLGLLMLIKPDTTIAFIIILQAAVPPITAIPIFADRLGGNRAIASQFIVGSFIFSLVSIPAMLYLFSLFFPVAI